MSTLENAKIVTIEPVVSIMLRETVTLVDMAPFFDRAFGVLAGALAEQQLVPAGAPYARYFGEPTETVEVEVGFPVFGTPVNSDTVSVGTLPGGRVATAVMRGSYEGLGAAWGALFEWIHSQGETPTDTMWEVYVTEPKPDMDPADLRTELYWPLA